MSNPAWLDEILARKPSWTVYLVRHPETKEVRYVGLSAHFSGRSATHMARDWGHPVEVVAIAEYDNEKSGRHAESQAIAAHSGPRLVNGIGQVLSKRARAAVKDLIRERGLRYATKHYGMSSAVVLNAAAGFSLNRGTILVFLGRMPAVAESEGYGLYYATRKLLNDEFGGAS